MIENKKLKKRWSIQIVKSKKLRKYYHLVKVFAIIMQIVLNVQKINNVGGVIWLINVLKEIQMDHLTNIVISTNITFAQEINVQLIIIVKIVFQILFVDGVIIKNLIFKTVQSKNQIIKDVQNKDGFILVENKNIVIFLYLMVASF